MAHEAADDGDDHEMAETVEQEGTEEDTLVLQEQDAAILAAEANRTLAEARAAIQKVRASRGYYPLGGKGDGTKGAPSASEVVARPAGRKEKASLAIGLNRSMRSTMPVLAAARASTWM